MLRIILADVNVSGVDGRRLPETVRKAVDGFLLLNVSVGDAAKHFGSGRGKLVKQAAAFLLVCFFCRLNALCDAAGPADDGVCSEAVRRVLVLRRKRNGR